MSSNRSLRCWAHLISGWRGDVNGVAITGAILAMTPSLMWWFSFDFVGGIYLSG